MFELALIFLPSQSKVTLLVFCICWNCIESSVLPQNSIKHPLLRCLVTVLMMMGSKEKLLDSIPLVHSKDYTRGMLDIINHETPEDFVLSTGQSHSVRDLCDTVFKYLDMDYNDYIVQNPKYMRPEELNYLKGDCTKAKKILNWKTEYTFESMIHEMVDYWMTILSTKHMEISS